MNKATIYVWFTIYMYNIDIKHDNQGAVSILKMSTYQHRDPHVQDKIKDGLMTILFLTWESPYPERRSLYWDRTLVFTLESSGLIYIFTIPNIFLQPYVPNLLFQSVNQIWANSLGADSIKRCHLNSRKSHCGDKMVIRFSYLHSGISYTGKTSCLYWIRPLVPYPCHLFKPL